jgi:hypothetical protein
LGDAATGLTTPERVKSFAMIKESSLDDQIKDLIEEVTDEIEQGIGRKIVVSEYTDVLDGSSFTELVLKRRPVIKFLSLKLDDTEVDSDGYQVNSDAGLVIAVTSGFGTSWSEGVRNYKATYTAGYAVIPAGIRGIATDIVARRINASKEKRVGLETEALGTGGSTTFESRDITKGEWKKLFNWGATA